MLVVPTACETLRDPLTVEPASRIPAGVAEISVNAQLLSDGAIADFECAFGSYTAIGGLVGEEFIYAQQTASRSPYDRRNTSKDDADYAINACNSGSRACTHHSRSHAHQRDLSLNEQWTDAEVSAGPASRTYELIDRSAYAATLCSRRGFAAGDLQVNPENRSPTRRSAAKTFSWPSRALGGDTAATTGTT